MSAHGIPRRRSPEGETGRSSPAAARSHATRAPLANAGTRTTRGTMSAAGVSLSKSPALDCPSATATATAARAQPTGRSRTRYQRRSAGLTVAVFARRRTAPPPSRHARPKAIERWPECKDERDSGRHGTRRKCGARREHETEGDEPGGAYGPQRSLSSVSSVGADGSVRPNGLGIGDSHRGRLRNGVGTSDDQQQTRSRGLATHRGAPATGCRVCPESHRSRNRKSRTNARCVRPARPECGPARTPGARR